METLKVFQESIDVENKEVVSLYNAAKSEVDKKQNDKIDAEIVENIEDAPETILAS